MRWRDGTERVVRLLRRWLCCRSPATAELEVHRIGAVLIVTTPTRALSFERIDNYLRHSTMAGAEAIFSSVDVDLSAKSVIRPFRAATNFAWIVGPIVPRNPCRIDLGLILAV